MYSKQDPFAIRGRHSFWLSLTSIQVSNVNCIALYDGNPAEIITSGPCTRTGKLHEAVAFISGS